MTIRKSLRTLRNLSFLIALLINTEIWYPIKDDDFKELIELDNALLRRIFDAPSSTPKHLLHLELGTIPTLNVIK